MLQLSISASLQRQFFTPPDTRAPPPRPSFKSTAMATPGVLLLPSMGLTVDPRPAARKVGFGEVLQDKR